MNTQPIPANFFLVECRACSRPLRVPKLLLDQQVVCRHCSLQFTAFDPKSSVAVEQPTFANLIAKVDQLLAQCEARPEVA